MRDLRTFNNSASTRVQLFVSTISLEGKVWAENDGFSGYSFMMGGSAKEIFNTFLVQDEK